MMTHKILFRRKLKYAFWVLLGIALAYLLLSPDSVLRHFLAALLADPAEQARLFSFFKTYGYWIGMGYVVFVSFMLFWENRNPDRTVAWLVVMGALPVVGVILYWIVGPNFRYHADRRRFRFPQPLEFDAALGDCAGSALAEGTASLVYYSSGAGVLSGCEVDILVDGEATFHAIKEQLAAARKSIVVESYIVGNDMLGNQIKDLLIERARAGVHVCFMYDAVGSWRIGASYVEALRKGGVHVHTFLPVAFPMLRGANYRNHRKIIVVDNQVAFTGGLNISDDYLGKNPAMGYWRDTHLRIRGPAVQALAGIAVKDMGICGASHEVIAPFSPGKIFSQAPAGDVAMQIVPSGPDTAWDTIQKTYFSLVSRARRNVWITTPYLIPGDALLEALCVAALSNVDVRLLIPGKADHSVVYWATLHSCGDLLRAGVRLFVYDRQRFVHAKTMTCDGSVFSAGTANFDTRSLSINFEVQAVMYDESLAVQAEDMFTDDLAHAKELTLADWEQRPMVQRLQENFGKLFSSLA